MNLLSKYTIQFPARSYTIDVLRYYPIIIDNFDTIPESELLELLLGSISFADSPFDYLVIMFVNKKKRVNPGALQIPKQLFIDMKKAIEWEEDRLPDGLNRPYPVKVSTRMIDCFEGKYDLVENDFAKNEDNQIGNFAEELWVFSKLGELLSEPEDLDYLEKERQEILNNVGGTLSLLKEKLSEEDYNWISEISYDTFSGKIFDNPLLNEVIEHLLNKGK